MYSVFGVKPRDWDSRVTLQTLTLIHLSKYITFALKRAVQTLNIMSLSTSMFHLGQCLFMSIVVIRLVATDLKL